MPVASDLRYQWVRLRLARVDRDELAELLVGAWEMCVPKAVAAQWTARSDELTSACAAGQRGRPPAKVSACASCASCTSPTTAPRCCWRARMPASSSTCRSTPCCATPCGPSPTPSDRHPGSRPRRPNRAPRSARARSRCGCGPANRRSRSPPPTPCRWTGSCASPAPWSGSGVRIADEARRGRARRSDHRGPGRRFR